MSKQDLVCVTKKSKIPVKKKIFCQSNMNFAKTEAIYINTKLMVKLW